jgi:chromosome segregation ATPase
LHRSERWQIGYLQERVDEQNRALRAMEEELAALRAQTSDQPDAADLAAERKEAQSAKRELAGAKKEVERAERTITSLRRSVGQWKSKYEKVQAEFDEIRESVVAADEAASTPPPPPGVSAASRITDGPSGPDGDSPDAPVAAPDLGEVP